MDRRSGHRRFNRGTYPLVRAAPARTNYTQLADDGCCRLRFCHAGRGHSALRRCSLGEPVTHGTVRVSSADGRPAACTGSDNAGAFAKPLLSDARRRNDLLWRWNLPLWTNIQSLGTLAHRNSSVGAGGVDWVAAFTGLAAGRPGCSSDSSVAGQ